MGDVVKMHGWISRKDLDELCDDIRILKFRADVEQPFIEEMVRVEYNRRRRLGVPAYQKQPYVCAPVEFKLSCRLAVYQTWAMVAEMQHTVIVAEREMEVK